VDDELASNRTFAFLNNRLLLYPPPTPAFNE
jgi:hypothetical protein